MSTTVAAVLMRRTRLSFWIPAFAGMTLSGNDAELRAAAVSAVLMRRTGPVFWIPACAGMTVVRMPRPCG